MACAPIMVNMNCSGFPSSVRSPTCDDSASISDGSSAPGMTWSHATPLLAYYTVPRPNPPHTNLPACTDLQ